MKFIKIKDVKTPSKGTDESAGFDFYVPNCGEQTFHLSPGQDVKIPSGIKLVLPAGYCLLMVNKSGVSLSGLQVGACLVDEDYRGELHLHVYNSSKNYVHIKAGQKLVQGILIPVPDREMNEISKEEFESYALTDRGEGGFGSTGLI